MKLRMRWPHLALGLILATPAFAAPFTGLPQVRYQLHLDPEASVIGDLRTFAERGDRPSMRLLASLLVAQGRLATMHEAIDWYWRAFDRGYGKPLALAGMSEIADRVPLFRERIRQHLVQGLARFEPTESFENLNSTLDVFLVYPDLVAQSRIDEWIGMYEHACVMQCRSTTYRARLFEVQGQRQAAEQAYRQAILEDARAIALYSRMLGDDSHNGLLSLARDHQDRLEQLPIDVIEMMAIALTRTPQAHDNAILRWLDQAVAYGSLDAEIARVRYQMTFPEVFDHAAVFGAIEHIRQRDAVEAEFLHVEALLVYPWPTLAPHEALAELNALAQRHPVRTQLALAQLYSRGGLDEPDHNAALRLYQPLLSQHNVVAYYRVAALYAGSPAMCPDPVKGYGYAHLAELLGSGQARSLRQRLTEQLDPHQLQQADALARYLRAQVEQTL